MVLNPSNSSNLEQLALNGLIQSSILLRYEAVSDSLFMKPSQLYARNLFDRPIEEGSVFHSYILRKH